MNKADSLKLVGTLAQASAEHAMAANGLIRRKNPAAREEKAAWDLLTALTDEPITPEELSEALGW